jgi:hypothetical protein
MIDKLLEDAFKIFGWEVEYFITEQSKEETLDNYKLTNIVDKVCIKVLIDDNINNVKNFKIKILKSTFLENKKPSVNDIIYIPGVKRLYYVEKVLDEDENMMSGGICFFNVELSQYEIKFKING